jgi:hypothetical protein
MDSAPPSQESMRIVLVQPHSFSSASFVGRSPADSTGEEANLETVKTYVAKAARHRTRRVWPSKKWSMR